jgi:CBS domain containing-hemolysin-like protein
VNNVIGFVLITIAVALAAFAAVSQSTISRIGRVRAHHLAQDKKRGSIALVAIANDPAPYLNAVVLLSVLAHVVGTSVATWLAVRAFGIGGVTIAIVIMTIVGFVLAEVVPKTFAVQRLDSAALTVAPTVRVVGRLLHPVAQLLVWLANAAMVLLPGKGLPRGPFVTEDEIKHLVDVAEEEEEIEEDERELIHSIFEFGDTVVREVMVPRPDMITLPSDATLDQALEVIVEAGYSRIPLYEGDNDNIIGVLYAKDVLKRVHESQGAQRVAALARKPTYVPEQKKVAELLREMQTQRVHMAIVVDEYGGTAGLVTIEDLIEEIVGEIVDEYDKEEPLVEPIDDETIRVDAKMPIDEVNELLGVDLPHEEWDTVGGLVFGLTGRVPFAGETVKFDSLEFRTERVTGRRIQKVVIKKLPRNTQAVTE